MLMAAPGGVTSPGTAQDDGNRTKPLARRTARDRRATKAPPPQVRDARAARSALAEHAAQHTLAANPLIGIRRKEVLATATTLVRRLAREPQMLSRQYAKFVADCARVVAGRSSLAPSQDDRRFADAAWTDSAVFRRLLAGLRRALHVARPLRRRSEDGRDDRRARPLRRFAVRGRDRADQFPREQPGGAAQARRHARARASSAASRTSSRTSRAARGCRGRSTRARSPSARTWRRHRARSSSATSCSS